MKANYAIVTVPAAAIRQAPNHRREMSNQVLFGEPVQVLQTRDTTWLKVKSLQDGYTGWLTHHLVTPVAPGAIAENNYFLAPRLLTPVNINGQSMHIPLGASLPNFQNKKGNIAGLTYTCHAKPIDTRLIKDPVSQLMENALLWLNAPYLWGGKTILGVDCSGFSQTQYKLIGRQLLRDARQQATQGTAVSSLKKARPGDLAFFDDRDEIVHVGILAEPGKIIHAAGKVRIDTIDAKGIINSETGVRTHQLRLIRRYLP